MGLPRVIRTLLVFRVKVRDILQLPETSIRMAVCIAGRRRYQHLAPSAPAAVAASGLINPALYPLPLAYKACCQINPRQHQMSRMHFSSLASIPYYKGCLVHCHGNSLTRSIVCTTPSLPTTPELSARLDAPGYSDTHQSVRIYAEFACRFHSSVLRDTKYSLNSTLNMS